MKKLFATLLFLAVICVVACAAAWVGSVFFDHRSSSSNGTTHDWIHSQLELTGEQEAALAPVERGYREQRDTLERALHDANVALADAILADGKDSVRVHEAIEEIHSRMGDLQKVTIGHVFSMRGILTPDQYDRLLHLTAEALRRVDEDSEHGESH